MYNCRYASVLQQPIWITMLANLGLDSRISELSGISGDYSESELQLYSRSLYYLLNIQFRKFCNGIVYSIALRYSRYSLYDRSLFKCG